MHPPPYVLKHRGAWRVIVPIRGRLSPKVCDVEFPTREVAQGWMQSADGVLAIAALTAKPKSLYAPAEVAEDEVVVPA